MNWGTKITIAMVLFMAFIVTLVVRISMASPDLVAENYYEQEVKFQDRIQAKHNASGLKEHITLKSENGNLLIELDKSILFDSGEIQLYRPNNAAMDLVIPFSELAEGFILIPNDQIQLGVYEVRLSWNLNEKKFFFSKRITIQ